MESYPEEIVKSFLKIETPKVKDALYYEVNSSNNIISLFDPIKKEPSDKSLNFEMDKIFTSENENSYIYEEICLNTIKESLEGISYSFISYGDTSSKKLDLLIGNLEEDISNINHRGIFPRLLDNLIKKIKLKENKAKKLSIFLSYFLVYNNNLVDLSKFNNIDLTNYTRDDLFNNAYIIKNETDIINKIDKIRIENVEESLLLLKKVISFLKKLEKESNEHLYSRSHISIVLYLKSKKNNTINTISKISFILLNGSEHLYSGKTQKLISQSHIEHNINKSLVDSARYTLETQFTYETIYNCIKSLKCLDKNENSNNYNKNDNKENYIFSQLTTVLYNICFCGDIKKLRFRIIGTILPNTGFYQSVKDTLMFLFECRSIMKKKKKIDLNENILKIDPSQLIERKKDDIIFDLENKVKNQKKEIIELTENVLKKEKKIAFLQNSYIEQINIIKKRLNFPGDINLLISGDENTKEAKFVKEMKEYQDCIKRNEGNIHILEKQLKIANEEISKLKNLNIIKNTDETMINYYLSVQKGNEDRFKESKNIKLLYSQIEELKKELNKINKINEELKKEIKNKNDIIFNLPFSLKESNTSIINKGSLSKHTNNQERQINISGAGGSIEKISELKDGKLNNNEKIVENKEKENSESLQDNDAYYSAKIKKINSEHKKNIEILKQKYEKLIKEKKDEFDEVKLYLEKMNDLKKKEIENYKKEIIKYNEVFMRLISNYKRIFFSQMTPQCSVVTLKNKKEEFDDIILNIDKEINHLNFPLLFKELETKNLLNMNLTGEISNMRKAALKLKKIKNNNINEDKKINENKIKLWDNVPPPTIKEIQNVMKEATNEGKIVMNKEKLNEMSKEAIILHCLNLNKIVIEMENYLEKYTQYKRGFNIEQFENNINYKESKISELNTEINKLTTNLDEQIQSNYNNMNVIQTQNRIIEKLRKEILYNNIMKNKKKNYNATMNTNINTNILINDNSTSSTLIPIIKNINSTYLASGIKLKKSNSCFNYCGGNNEMNEIDKKVSIGGKKEELNTGLNYLSSTKKVNNYRDRNLQNSNKNHKRVDNMTAKSFTNNRKIRPFSSTRGINKDEIYQINN